MNFFRTQEQMPGASSVPRSEEFVKKPTENEVEPTPAQVELVDSLEIWKTQAEIEMKSAGLPADIPNMFDVTQRVQDEEMVTTDSEKQPSSQEKQDRIHELHPQSYNNLTELITDIYQNGAFASAARAVFDKRGMPREHHMEALEHLSLNAAHKIMDAFHDSILQVLAQEYGMDQQTADQYISWRFDGCTQDNPIQLVTDGDTEKLVADQCITTELVQQFFVIQENMHRIPEQESEKEIVTSEGLDEMLSDIHKI